MAFNIHKTVSARARPLGRGSGSLSYRRLARNLELDLSQIFPQVAPSAACSPKLRRGSRGSIVCDARPERIPMCFSNQASTIELRLPLDVSHPEYATSTGPSSFDGRSHTGAFESAQSDSSTSTSSSYTNFSYESEDSGFQEDCDMDSDMECGDCAVQYDDSDSDTDTDPAEAFDFEGLSARLRGIGLANGDPSSGLDTNGMTFGEVMELVQRLHGYSLVAPDRMETGC
ncbi:hypothetical protein BJ508DRAFT_359334 [Ascobolus immersus RN42]|uniref:Uncharacterized protein n=1 Tax=Ascobolus immersus RN42 TaxID=1160509 RepID=A0A3N4IH50_ASCIM|nr:hypothetical protein BJ508DRAFT_359334 [Ascobolus immersus RN42]